MPRTTWPTGFHGIELALLLLSEFVADGRTYVSKQRRVEQVADDIAAQVSGGGEPAGRMRGSRRSLCATLCKA